MGTKESGATVVTLLLGSLVALILLGVIAITAHYGVRSSRIIESRELEERVIVTGNRVETHARLVASSADLALLQALYNLGQNTVLYEGYEYNPDNHLPYWDDIPDDFSEKLLDLSETYFNAYFRSFVDYFNAENEKRWNMARGITWSLDWNPQRELEMKDDYVRVKFGSIRLRYDSKSISVEREVPVEGYVKTKFSRMLKTGERIIDEINRRKVKTASLDYSCCFQEPGAVPKCEWEYGKCGGSTPCRKEACTPSCEEFCNTLGGTGTWINVDKVCECKIIGYISDSELGKIKLELEGDGIRITLRREGSFVYVQIREDEPRSVYNPIDDRAEKQTLELNFLVELAPSAPRTKPESMENVHRCDSGWMIRSTNPDICSVLFPPIITEHAEPPEEPPKPPPVSGCVSHPDPTGLEVRLYPSPNCNPRGGVNIDRLVIHYTAGNLDSALNVLTKSPNPCGYDESKDCRVSAHYVIDRDGKIYQLVGEDYVAWHAGCRATDPDCLIPGMNQRSIGIELVNWGFLCPGKGYPCVHLKGKDWEVYPDEQIQALVKLSADILRRNPGIKPDRSHILGHEEVYLQKSDPGPAFPWERYIEELKRSLGTS